LFKILSDPNVCPRKEKCENQRFKKQLYPKQVLYATEDIQDGAFLNEFVIEEHFKIENLDDMLKESIEKFQFQIGKNKIIFKIKKTRQPNLLIFFLHFFAIKLMLKIN